MALIEFIDSCIEIDREHLVEGIIESPESGSNQNLYSFLLKGWVIGKHERIKWLSIDVGDKHIKKIPIDRPRPGLAKKFPQTSSDDNCGFLTEVGILGLPPVVELTISAVLANKMRVPFGKISLKHQPIDVNYKPKLQPILVTSIGRSGSTWMMRVLSAHPEIVVHLSHPYETMAASYWMHMLKVLSDPANHVQSAQRIGFKDNIWWVGQHPYNTRPFTRDTRLMEWFNKDYPQRIAEFCMSSIDDFYLKMAEIQEQHPSRFAEKSRPTHIPWLFNELYAQTREIFLVRDFRDTICSMLAFNQKRGNVGVGPRAADSDEEFIRLLLPRIQDMVDAFDQRKDISHWVRYEDLVLTPEKTIIKILNYLGLEHNQAIVTAMIEGTPSGVIPQSQFEDRGKGLLQQIKNRFSGSESKLAQHQTTGDPKASIDRWKTDLSPHLQEVCKEVFGEHLLKFGYKP